MSTESTAALTAPSDDQIQLQQSPSTGGDGALSLPADDASEARAAAQRREETWLTREDWTFLGAPLEKWSMARESLFVRLTDADTVGETLDNIVVYERHLARSRENAEKAGKLAEVASLTLDDLVNPNDLLSAAAKVLYLASRKPEAWDVFRGRENTSRFLREIESWAEAVILPGKVWDAIMLARDFREKHRDVIAVRRPFPGGGQQAGN